MGKLSAGVITVTPFQQNCTILFDDADKTGVVIDPGGLGQIEVHHRRGVGGIETRERVAVELAQALCRQERFGA